MDNQKPVISSVALSDEFKEAITQSPKISGIIFSESTESTVSKKALHHCDAPDIYSGGAIDSCLEDEDGVLTVGNCEYESKVNYCPFCGYKAKKQINE